MKSGKPYLLAALGLVLFLGLWELIPGTGMVARTLLPTPSQLPAALAKEIQSGIWQHSVMLSLSHYLLGLAVGTSLGVLLGVLTGMYTTFEWSLAWVVRVLRPIPGLAWVPFAIMWFGIDQAAAVFIISVGVFWIVFFAAQGAIRSVDRDLIEVAEAFGFKSGPEKLVKVLFPAALPGILVGLRTALGQAWMSVVAAELFGVQGLGQRMNEASTLLATDIVVVYMLTMAALYGLMDALFVFVQSRLLAWKA
jgi:sulfonate transport system permease protein